jgi:hypothetical protein
VTYPVCWTLTVAPDLAADLAPIALRVTSVILHESGAVISEAIANEIENAAAARDTERAGSLEVFGSAVGLAGSFSRIAAAGPGNAHRLMLRGTQLAFSVFRRSPQSSRAASFFS